MADLEVLAAQLANALDRLEALALPLVEARARAVRDAAEIGRLGAENERLQAHIAELEEEARALAGVTDEVETRLDDAIAEIRTALAR